MKLAVAVVVCCYLATRVHALTNEEVIEKLNATKMLLEAMNQTIISMQRQMVLNQLYLDEKVRSDGDSGIKTIRNNREGTRPYYSDSHVGNAVAAIHDHSDNIRTVGMGEIEAVMNGWDFRTRHNDYRLYMPSDTNELNSYVDIPFPDVPPEVLNKATLEEQIVEMREWFKAWQTNTKSTRDFTKYFKPVLCYLEGAWLYADGELHDPDSDRHQLDADSYEELIYKVMYTSYTGSKESGENLAFIPRVLWNVTESGEPIFAQWSYRIMCHPLQRELPLNRLRVVDELKARMVQKETLADYVNSKKARFALNVWDSSTFEDRQSFKKLQELLMNEIPGKNNYGAYLEDIGIDGLAKDPFNTSKVLNAAYYHRRHSTGTDASGNQAKNRGYSDQNMYMALTDQPLVVSMDNVKCTTGESACEDPAERSQKWSYAIPMEIIWLTPLNTWNPFNITYRGDAWTEEGKKVTADGRNGAKEKPFDGVNHANYFITPSEFFSDGETDQDPADTAPAGAVYVLDNTGTSREVRASGTRILFPEIEGLGTIRQRYPIMPVHGEGSAAWKELEALKDVALAPVSHSHMYYEEFASGGSNSGGSGDAGNGDMQFVMSASVSGSVSQHTHSFVLTENQRSTLSSGGEVTVETTQGSGHTHTLVLVQDTAKCNQDEYKFAYKLCDNSAQCWDGHGVCNMKGSSTSRK